MKTQEGDVRHIGLELAPLLRPVPLVWCTPTFDMRCDRDVICLADLYLNLRTGAVTHPIKCWKIIIFGKTLSSGQYIFLIL